MSTRAKIITSFVVGVVALAAAAFVAISLISTGTLGVGALQLPGLGGNAADSGKRQGYEIIPPTELPPTQPGLVGPVVAIKDKSFVVVPQTKGSGGQDGPATEVVVTADTKVYRDVTKGSGTIQIVNGRIQQRVTAYSYDQIRVGDALVVWGYVRGDRLVADTLMVEVHNGPSATATP